MVTARSVGAVSVSASVAALLAGLGSNDPAVEDTVTVLVSEPMADGLIWPTAVKVTVPPDSKVTVVTMSPVPLGADALDPGEAVVVQLTLVKSSTGNRSVTAAPTAVLGPLLVTVMM